MRSFAFVSSTLALLVALSATPVDAARPNIDVSSRIPRASADAALRLRTDPALRALGTVASVDERFGVPSFVWASPEPRSAATLRSLAVLPPAQSARAHLQRLAPLYGLTGEDVGGATLRHVHDTGRGGVIATFLQSFDGVEVFGAEARLLMRRDGSLVAVAGAIPGRAAAGRQAPATFRLGANEALARALGDFAGRSVQAGGIRRLASAQGGFETYDASDVLDAAGRPIAPDPLRAKRVYFPVSGALVPAFYTEVMGETEAYAYVISAADGSILFRNDLIADANFTYRVWADASGLKAPFDGPQGAAGTPHPTGNPDGSDPGFIAPVLVTLQNGPISTNDPWLDPLAADSRGNNVDAYADLSSPDGFSAGDLRAPLSGANTFDYTYNTAQAPGASTTQRYAAVTQLFYTNNFLHDWFYDSGFDEAAGNAQLLNYGRGGLEGDVLRAEAQDYSGFNNANMATPSDGASPRMQMYVFTPSGGASLQVTSPPLGTLAVGVSTSFGPQTFNVSGDLILAVDNSAPTGDGCSALVNVVAGKIVLIDRGICGFTVKAANAQAAGAIGVIIANNVAGAPPGLGGTDPTITIPVLSVSQADGNTLKTALGGGTVTVTMLRSAEIQRDGTLDNLVVAHEWGHYISNRLVGNANGLSTNQSAGMGEGWGDFLSLLLAVREGDDLLPGNADFGGVYSTAPYAVGKTNTPHNGFYFGFRRYPYSTDIANRNPLTFKHIEEGVALPVGPPIQANGNSNAQVHNTGEVWCSMLWECYAALLRDTGRLTFTQARDRMRDYLVAGLKMTPSAPTFVEARDAILAAALANDVADFDLFWLAFAKRGLGVGAVAPDRFSATNAGVVESFVVGGEYAVDVITLADDVASCDSDGYLDDGETGTLTVTLRNTGAVTLSGTTATVTTTHPDVSIVGSNVIAFPSAPPMGTTSGSVTVALNGTVGLTVEDFQIDYDDPALLVAGPIAVGFEKRGNADEVASANETVEALNPTWTTGSNPSLGGTPWARTPVSASSHVFHVPDAGSLSDQYLISPPLDVDAVIPFTFSFEHRHSFESSGGTDWDGGVIEISTNGGGSWSDIGASATPGYNGTIFVGADNPLSGRPAYCDDNAAWPATNVVNVDLGGAYAGQTVQVRFRVGTDQAVGDFGWDIDNLVFGGITNTPFLDVVAEGDVCTPVAVDPALPVDWSFALGGAHPVVGSASFRFALPEAGRVTVSIVDVTGRRVATVVDGEFAAGIHTAAWPASTARPAGVYFARMQAGGRTFMRRVVVLP